MTQFHSAVPKDGRRTEAEHIPENQIVNALYEAYIAGRAAPRPPVTDNWKARWQARLKQQSHCSVQDEFFLMRCIQFAEKARGSAAAGELSASCQLFGLARALVSSTQLSHEGRLRCQVEVAAAEAYLDYFCGDFEQAKQKLLDSMLAAQELEEIYGYTVLHIHRIHLLNNMVKVEARANRLSQAMELAASIILYLQEKTETIQAPASWGRSYSRWMTLEDRRFLSAQLVGEIAAATAGAGPRMFHDVFKALAERVNIDEPHPSWHPEGRAWLQLKVSCAIEEDVLVYLKRCISYLAQGPGTGMLLWHLAALDTANACKRLDGSQARLFQSAVLADLRQVKSAPRHIRVLVDRMLARLAQAGPTEVNEGLQQRQFG